MMYQLSLRVSWVCLLFSFGVCVPLLKSDYTYPYVLNNPVGEPSGSNSLEQDDPQDQSPPGIQGAGPSPTSEVKPIVSRSLGIQSPNPAAEPAYGSWYRIPDTRVNVGSAVAASGPVYEPQYSPPKPSYPATPVYEPQYSPPKPAYPATPVYEPQYSPPKPAYPATPVYVPQVSPPKPAYPATPVYKPQVSPPKPAYPATPVYKPQVSPPVSYYPANTEAYYTPGAPAITWFEQPDLAFLTNWKPSSSFPDFSVLETQAPMTYPLPSSYIIQTRNGYVRAKEVHSHSKYTQDPFNVPVLVSAPSKTSGAPKGSNKATW
ncbi:adhesive plaque matrix protein-like [Mugil cephalus]|uniref:adhesive plaque matrix protein-like n=1 Tax=Mugil cephalus TaxID=48193 RepID=UPI001FB6AF57|nr:adhesive plaque matrix protein-like [Mugil cephalus]